MHRKLIRKLFIFCIPVLIEAIKAVARRSLQIILQQRKKGMKKLSPFNFLPVPSSCHFPYTCTVYWLHVVRTLNISRSAK